MLYAIVALVVVLIDQWVKFYTAGVIHFENAGVPLIPGLISMVNVHNTGAAFSLFSGGNARIYFIIITGVFTVAVIIALATKFVSGPVARWSLVLMTAGGLSNCIDRVIYGYVQDMFKFEPLPSFPVFNVADIVITVFCILFILSLFFEKDRKKQDDYADAFSDDEDEEEFEVEKPARKPLSRRGAKAAAIEDEDDEEDEPVRRPQRARKAQAQPAEESFAAPASGKTEFSLDFGALDDVPISRHGSAGAPTPPAQTAKPAAARPQAQPAARPQTQAAPRPQAQKPAPKAAVEEEFSLDDILAEFKNN